MAHLKPYDVACMDRSVPASSMSSALQNNMMWPAWTCLSVHLP